MLRVFFKDINIQADKLTSEDAANVMTNLIKSAADYRNTIEREQTKRLEIKAKLDTYIRTINKQKAFFECYFEKEYSLRKETIDELFIRLDRAIDANKDDVAIKALDAIEGVIKGSPLKSLSEFKNAIDKGVVIEL